jgi:hypothetical protein
MDVAEEMIYMKRELVEELSEIKKLLIPISMYFAEKLRTELKGGTEDGRKEN